MPLKPLRRRRDIIYAFIDYLSRLPLIELRQLLSTGPRVRCRFRF